jgi:hypothetical protein
MEIMFGTLSIIESELTSLLEPGDNWLLLARFPDPDQAGRAATNFILNVKHLSNGAPVAVTGARNTIGTQPVIVMTDINAAGSLVEHAMAAMKGGKTSRSKSKNLSSKSDGGKERALERHPSKKAKQGAKT